jgi:protein-tyrosine-phosphatase
MNLLFVCSGNTCRSPLAVAAWQTFAPVELQGIHATSAGLAAVDGVPATPHAVDAARNWGYDLGIHRARRLTPEDLQEADLVLCMTPDHVEFCQCLTADPGRVQLLATYKSPARERQERSWFEPLIEEAGLAIEDDDSILDPFGGSAEAYEACATQIRRCVVGLAQALCESRNQRGDVGE